MGSQSQVKKPAATTELGGSHAATSFITFYYQVKYPVTTEDSLKTNLQ